MKKVFLYLIIYFCLTPAVYSKDVSNLEVIHITDYYFTMGNKQAVMIYFGESQKNYCQVTIYRDSVNIGYRIESRKKDDNHISAECNWAGKYYVQSSKHKTSVNLEIKTIDKANKTAALIISLNLVESKTGKYFKLENMQINIKENYFINLTK